ncbi:hypothetical protein LSH36_1g07022 [Paralvinella palmiformis]|uniref:Uncharacterized protein n=1 Tax=Paralvinella palmiformis TaxID=53620 RepID=A0AAD9NHN7_9ANNE|nr:hypothetical protein LSH36_1g07022 [Paralvinella palmiformis]
MGRRKEKDYQTRNRLDHGRGTHFVLGYDRADYNSEHVHNFQGKTQPAVELPPAGKKEHKPSTRFNHFYHSENAADTSAPNPYAPNIGESLLARSLAVTRAMPSLPSHKATIMKNDFQPLPERRYTPAQLVVLGQNARLESKPIAVSHYFHTDLPTIITVMTVEPSTTSNDNFLQ